MPVTPHHSSLKDPEMKPILSNGGEQYIIIIQIQVGSHILKIPAKDKTAQMKLYLKLFSGTGKQPPTPPVPPGPPTAPKPSTGAPGLLQGPKLPPLEPETEAGVPTILGPPSNGGILLPSMTAAAGEKVSILCPDFIYVKQDK